jgi:hypothetical protein
VSAAGERLLAGGSVRGAWKAPVRGVHAGRTVTLEPDNFAADGSQRAPLAATAPAPD